MGHQGAIPALGASRRAARAPFAARRDTRLATLAPSIPALGASRRAARAPLAARRDTRLATLPQVKGWARSPDIARVSRTPLSQAARAACLDQVMRALWRSSLFGIPASSLLALILGSSVPAPRRVAFVLVVSVADVITLVCTARYLGRWRRGG